MTPSPGRARLWWLGARPRTLGAGLVPVVAGAAAAGTVVPWRLGAAFLVALGLQVGVNYANDYFDGVRGVDTGERRGPPRLTASGLAPPRTVAIAAGLALSVAAAAGLALALATDPVLVLGLGALAILAAVLYSGGPRPYGSLGLGEVMVFVFFGLVATAGTSFVLAQRVPAPAWWAGSAVGLLAVAILVANNLRDIPTDAAVGKRTLAVRLGSDATRTLYRAVVGGAFVVVVAGVAVGEGSGLPVAALLALAALAVAARPLRRVGSAEGSALVPVLVDTALVHAVFGLLLAVGLWLG